MCISSIDAAWMSGSNIPEHCNIKIDWQLIMMEYILSYTNTVC